MYRFVNYSSKVDIWAACSNVVKLALNVIVTRSEECSRRKKYSDATKTVHRRILKYEALHLLLVDCSKYLSVRSS